MGIHFDAFSQVAVNGVVVLGSGTEHGGKIVGSGIFIGDAVDGFLSVGVVSLQHLNQSHVIVAAIVVYGGGCGVDVLFFVSLVVVYF